MVRARLDAFSLILIITKDQLSWNPMSKAFLKKKSFRGHLLKNKRSCKNNPSRQSISVVDKIIVELVVDRKD
jgi:hypothetical protein